MSDLGFRTLEADDIEVRVANCTEKGASLLLYKDARCDMRILDEAVGPESWQCRYREEHGNLFCEVGVFCANESNGVTIADWVWKEDVGTPSNMEGEKGEASDAFKRACFKWGIGRELYSAPFIYVKKGDCQISKNSKGKPACYDRFSVSEIRVEDGRITELSIRNDSLDRQVWSTKKETPFDNIKRLKAEAIEVGIKEEGIKSWIDATFDKPMRDFSPEEIKQVEVYIAKLISDKRELDSESD